MSGKIFFNSHKILTWLLAGSLGLIGGISAGSYGIGVEKTKITLKLEQHDQKFIDIMNLIHEDGLRTNEVAQKIIEAVNKIQIDIAVLKDHADHP